MKRFSTVLRSCLMAAGLATVSSAQATLLFDFTLPFTSGPVPGTLTGNLTLTFVSAGGSGTGAASQLAFTSIPAGFAPLAGGNTPTAWANQVANSFTVTNGVITDFAFFAVTGPNSGDDAFAMNSTNSSLGTFGSWGAVAHLNELSQTVNTFGYNFDGYAGVSFTPSSPGESVPVPGTLSLVLAAAAGLSVRRARASRRQVADGAAHEVHSLLR